MLDGDKYSENSRLGGGEREGVVSDKVVRGGSLEEII
jgi:hypothetical protein